MPVGHFSPDGIRNCTPRNPPRRSARSRSWLPLAPPGLSPSESPTAFSFHPASECSGDGQGSASTFPPSGPPESSSGTPPRRAPRWPRWSSHPDPGHLHLLGPGSTPPTGRPSCRPCHTARGISDSRWPWPQTIAFVGVLGLCLRVMRLPPFPRPYLVQKLDSSRGPSLREVIRPRFIGTSTPSDFLLAPGRFGSALSPQLSHSRAPRRISPVPLSAVLSSRPLYPGGSPAGALPRGWSTALGLRSLLPSP